MRVDLISYAGIRRQQSSSRDSSSKTVAPLIHCASVRVEIARGFPLTPCLGQPRLPSTIHIFAHQNGAVAILITDQMSAHSLLRTQWPLLYDATAKLYDRQELTLYCMGLRRVSLIITTTTRWVLQICRRHVGMRCIGDEPKDAGIPISCPTRPQNVRRS